MSPGQTTACIHIASKKSRIWSSHFCQIIILNYKHGKLYSLWYVHTIIRRNCNDIRITFVGISNKDSRSCYLTNFVFPSTVILNNSPGGEITQQRNFQGADGFRQGEILWVGFRRIGRTLLHTFKCGTGKSHKSVFWKRMANSIKPQSDTVP